jgi:DNA mismatch endonuclease (patch repair protein)|tara:strand:+ start:43 stop:438 length:396 start_codon:yes stop_codon:yes gene_type:complete
MDTVSKKKRSEIMSKIRSKDTLPELTVRKYIFSKGLRYRLHDRKLPGTPDIVSKKNKLAIQVRGCFWHGHKCAIGHYPKSNRNFWYKKIKKNISRDSKNDRKLKTLGYKLVIIKECEILKKKFKLKIDKFL